MFDCELDKNVAPLLPQAEHAIDIASKTPAEMIDLFIVCRLYNVRRAPGKIRSVQNRLS